MKNRFLQAFHWMVLGSGLLPPIFAWGDQASYHYEYVQGHRCVVARPEDLSDEAPVVVVLHGFGVDGEVCYENFHSQLRLPPCLMVFPDGRMEVSSPARREWYGRYTHSYRDMENSRDFLLAVLDHFSREPSEEDSPGRLAHPRPAVVMGESQGGVMSFETGLNYRGPLAAIVSIVGFIEYPEKTLAHPRAARNTPILMVNGEYDPVIQEEDAIATVKALRRSGYRPLLKEFPVGHHITQAMMGEISVFLQKVLAEKEKRLPQNN